MERLNLTLDADTLRALDRYARARHRPRAALARELLREALARQERLERRAKIARDYAEGRGDARELLAELSPAQLELLDGDEDPA